MDIRDLRERCEKRFKVLNQEYETNWKEHHKDLADYLLPRKARFLNDDTTPNNGDKRNENIIDNTAGRAIKVLAAGMQGGLTSPARPWFKLGLPDKDLAEFGPVKIWLDDVRRGMMYVFSRSNLYNVIHSMYAELGTFGTAAMLIEEDYDNVIRCVPFTMGEYYLALDANYRADTLYRTAWKTAGNIVKEFGIDSVSAMVKDAVRTGNIDQWVQLVHVIEPNTDRQVDKADNTNMPWRSIYYEYKGESDKILRRSGYNMFPVMAPRWDVTGSEVYGRCPGMDVLPDVMMLQKIQEDKLSLLDKTVNPPMNAPETMRDTGGGTLISGGINYIDTIQGSQTFAPVFEPNPQGLVAANEEIVYLQQNIKEGFFNDLFLMLAGTTGREMTATEVAERHEEKMLMVGPVIERLQPELLDRIIDRTYEIMFRKRLLPPPPPELEGMDLQVEYISLLAQAQKLVGISSLEQFAGFVGNVSAVFPESVDMVDIDAVVEEYADMIGVPPKAVRSKEQVKDIRSARAERQMQMEMQEDMAVAAQNAKVLSEANTGGNNALTALTGGL